MGELGQQQVGRPHEDKATGSNARVAGSSKVTYAKRGSSVRASGRA
jgi:hypothetical protein